MNDSTMTTYTHILHFADIHIRAGDVVASRRAEYLHVYKQLETSLDALACVRAGTALAVVCGDVFHHKYRLEGPTIQLWTEFVRLLTDRMPVVIISGNHDFRQERPEDPNLIDVMMETLPPLKNPCRYVRDTGTFEMGGLALGVVAIQETLCAFDTSGVVEKLPEFPLPDTLAPKVALFHGTITQSSLPNGQLMSAGKGYPLEWFKGYDMLLLGDNHLQQVHKARPDEALPAWGYPGSLVQQDFGEPVLGHGYLLWDVANRTATAHHVRNEYGRVRAKVIKGEVHVRMVPGEYWVPFAEAIGSGGASFPTRPHVSVIGSAGDDKVVSAAFQARGVAPTSIATILNVQHGTEGADGAEEVAALNDLAVVHSPTKWIEYIRRSDPELARALAVLGWLDDPDKIVQDMVVASAALPEELQKKIKERTERVQQAVTAYRSIQERSAQPSFVNLVYMEWAWAFAYGEHNWFNFETLEHDIALLNGKNASGKSSFIDVLCIALFGEPGKNRNINVSKRMTSMIIHHQKPARAPMHCTIVFELAGGDRYMIERVYTPHKTKTDEFGVQMSKCELHRVVGAQASLVCSGATLVDGWVKTHCGSIEDMLESTVVSQMDIHNFFMLKPNDQKERIDQSLNLESIQAFGAILQQATMAYNLWIDALGTCMENQRNVHAQLLADAGGEEVAEYTEERVRELRDRTETLERLSYKLAALAQGASVEEEGCGAEVVIPDDLVERRGQLRKALETCESMGIDAMTIDEANDLSARLDQEYERLQATRPSQQTRAIEDIDAEAQELDVWLGDHPPIDPAELEAAEKEMYERHAHTSWLSAVWQGDDGMPMGTDMDEEVECATWVNAYDSYTKAVDILKEQEVQAREVEKTMLQATPIREEAKAAEWDARWSEWSELAQEAEENEWPDVDTCKRACDKCRVSLNKMDKLEYERGVIEAHLAEVRISWKREARAFRERYARDVQERGGGFQSADEVMEYEKAWKRRAQLDVEWDVLQRDERDLERWQALLDEKQNNKWKSAEACERHMRRAYDAQERRRHLETWIPDTKIEVAELQSIPFNPECAACCQNPTHRRRERLEKELATAIEELEGLPDADAVQRAIDGWRRGVTVCSEIEKNEEGMRARRQEHEERVAAWKKAAKRCQKQVDAYGNVDPGPIVQMWVELQSAKGMHDAERARVEEREQGLVAKLAEITKKQDVLGSREDLQNALEAWEHAYVSQQKLDAYQGDWMLGEKEAWDRAREQWAPWNELRDHFKEESDRLAVCLRNVEVAQRRAKRTWVTELTRATEAYYAAKDHVEELRRIAALIPEKQARRHGLREERDMAVRWAQWKAQWDTYEAQAAACDRVLQRHRLKEEWDQLDKLHRIAAYRMRVCQEELHATKEELRRAELGFAAAKRAADIRHKHVAQLTEQEVLWERWRARRDVTSSAYQMLVGGGEDTYKEWVYETYVIPLLEKHINTFLAATTALKIEIEYMAKALRFVVVDRGNRTTFGLSSGFQQFMIGLALRLALTRLGGRGHRFRTLIIDEGFVACDADNVQYARDILQHMMEAGGFRQILLATHLETIKDMIVHKIPIHREGPFSRLQVGGRMTIAHEAAGAKRVRSKKSAV